MSDETPTTTEQPTAQTVPATNVPVAYEDASRLVTSGGNAQLALFSNVNRDPVRLDGVIKEPLPFREAMATLYAVVGSDYRYVPKDRTAYLAYLRVKRESAGQGVRQAQQAFFEWALRNDPLAFTDPRSRRDCSPRSDLLRGIQQGRGDVCQARHRPVRIRRWTASRRVAQPTSTSVPTLFSGIEQMRSYRQTRLSVGKEAVALATTSTAKVWKNKFACRTLGCAASSRCSRPPPCRATSSGLIRSTYTICFATCGSTATVRADAAGCASN